MKIVVAPDKFKGSLSADEVAAAIERGVRRVDPNVRIDRCPVADGGEGTVAALVAATGGRFETRRVTGPRPDMKVDATFGVMGDSRTAVVEMAAASGLALLEPRDRDSFRTTTYGTGELLVEAAKLRVEQIILGIGGSATVDGGIGCAQACGLPVILDSVGPADVHEPLVGEDLRRVVLVKRGRGSAIDRVKIVVACDVTNPLFGENGAARVFGPQKGATPQQVEELDALLRRLAERCGALEAAETAGAGAAGGLGFAMLAFFDAQLRRGFDIVADAVDLRGRLRGAALCITGEGRFDSQTAGGKTVAGVAALCAEAKVPCIVLAGEIADAGRIPGVTATFSICNAPMSLAEASRDAAELTERAAVNVTRLLNAHKE